MRMFQTNSVVFCVHIVELPCNNVHVATMSFMNCVHIDYQMIVVATWPSSLSRRHECKLQLQCMEEHNCTVVTPVSSSASSTVTLSEWRHGGPDPGGDDK